MKKLIIKFLLGFLILILAALFFQNCGQISLAPKQPEVITLASQILPSGDFCSESGAAFGAQVRFVFILDMSISNLGNAKPRCEVGIDPDGRCPWYLGFSLTPEQDPNVNINNTTDKEGLRFDIIDGNGQNGKPEGFLLKCGSQADFQYSLIGFGSDIMFGGVMDTCSSPFKNSTAIRQNVAALRSVQNSDISINGTSSDPNVSPFKMGETYYSKAISCLQKKVEYDAALTTDQPLYQVFFMTDGRPTDYRISPCTGMTGQTCAATYPDYFACESLTTAEAKNACRTQFYISKFYKPNLIELQDYTRSVSGTMKFQPIYYGKETGVTRDNAINALNEMAHAIDPNTNTREIQDFNTLASELCNSYKPQAKISYQQKQVWAANLSTVYSMGEHLPDSDGDGIDDSKDINPKNPRSSGGVLDSLCFLKNGSAPCAKPTPLCDTEFVGIGLNRCDTEIAKTIYGKELTGYDTDSDGLPDFLEIRFGLNPTISDVGESDLDGDGMTNANEIREGLNPKEYFNKISDKDRLLWSSTQVTKSGCDPGENQYSFEFQQIPLAETLGYSGNIGNIDISTSPGENLLIMTVIQDARGRPNLQKKMTMQLIRTTKTEAPKIETMQFIGDF